MIPADLVRAHRGLGRRTEKESMRSPESYARCEGVSAFPRNAFQATLVLSCVTRSVDRENTIASAVALRYTCVLKLYNVLLLLRRPFNIVAPFALAC
jgi:hypothetical protein